MAQETGKIVSWLKKEGETVAKGEILLEVETDKAVVEIEATADGVLAGVKSHEGDVVPVGQTIAWLVAPGEQPPADSPASAAPAAALSSIARLMAERTTQSWTQVPHFFLVREVDARALIELREKLGVATVTHTDLLVALTSRVLAKHPKLNASWDNGTIRLN